MSEGRVIIRNEDHGVVYGLELEGDFRYIYLALYSAGVFFEYLSPGTSQSNAGTFWRGGLDIQ